jgi:hypothetical protein
MSSDGRQVMKVNTQYFRLGGLGVSGALLAAVSVIGAGSSLWAQQYSVGPAVPVTTYRLECQTVYDEQRTTVYRLQYETVYEEREVTTQRPEWVTEHRQRRVRVAKPVVETSMHEKRQVVHKPVWETSMEERRRQVVKYVTETSTREERHVVHRPVWETHEREEQHVVRRAVTDTVMQQQQFTTMEPVTTMRTQYVDQGGFVDHQVYRPGDVRNRLQCLPGGYYQDPASGQTVWRRRGLHWVASQDPGRIDTFRQYVPNVVAQQVPQTTLMPRVVTQETPVQVTRYVDDVVVHKVPVQVCRMEAVEEVRQIPVTVQRPVTEEFVEQVPVQTLKWIAEETVEQIPVTTRRIVYEDHIEEVPVRVCRMVTETHVQRVPRTVARWVPHEVRRKVPRTVVMRVPVDPCLPPGVSIPPPPSLPPTTTRRVPVEENGEVENEVNGARESPSDRPPAENGTNADKWDDAERREPRDTDPTGQPRLNLSDPRDNAIPPDPASDTDPELNGADPGHGNGGNQPDSNRSNRDVAV